MIDSIARRLSYANVTATLALLVALAGTGYAATTIGTSQIANGAVTTPKVANGAVTAAKLGSGAVTAAKLGSGAVSAAKLGSSAVTAAKLGSGAVTAAKLGSGVVTGDKLASGAVTSAKIAAGAVGASQVQPGSLTPAIFAAGQAPGINPAKISVITGSAVVPPDSPGQAVTATCPAGQRAIAGGYSTGFNALAIATGPTTDGSGWTVVAFTGSDAASVTASAVCAAP
jgi:hypothetical protein